MASTTWYLRYLLVSGSTTSVITVDNSHKISSTLKTPSTCICTINYTTDWQNACYQLYLLFSVLSFVLSRMHQAYIRPASSSPQPYSLFSFLSVNHVTKFSCLYLSREVPSPSHALFCFSSRSLRISQPQFQETWFLVGESLPSHLIKLLPGRGCGYVNMPRKKIFNQENWHFIVTERQDGKQQRIFPDCGFGCCELLSSLQHMCGYLCNHVQNLRPKQSLNVSPGFAGTHPVLSMWSVSQEDRHAKHLMNYPKRISSSPMPASSTEPIGPELDFSPGFQTNQKRCLVIFNVSRLPPAAVSTSNLLSRLVILSFPPRREPPSDQSVCFVVSSLIGKHRRLLRVIPLAYTKFPSKSYDLLRLFIVELKCGVYFCRRKWCSSRILITRSVRWLSAYSYTPQTLN